MKIGVITWFDSSNYGTNLQAIALQRYLRNKGYNVSIVNFKVDLDVNTRLSLGEKLANWKMLGKRIRRQPEKYVMKWAIAKYGNEIERRDCKLREAIRDQCNLTEEIQDEKHLVSVLCQFDLLISGSDQIWNPGWYHRFYYADYDEVKTKRISYAASLGVNSIMEEKRNDIKRSLSKFSAVSVREQKGAELLRPLMKGEAAVVVDPTLLLNAEEWGAIFPIQKQTEDKYVISMFLTDNFAHWRAAELFVKEKKLRHIVIPYCGFSYFKKADIAADAGLQEFLDLIRGAEYVLTDSFHVTVFSLINKKQFFTFARFREDSLTSQNVRVQHILHIAGTEERLLPYGTRKIPDMSCIEYKIVLEALEREIEKSKVYLKIAIEK